jgi:hypothetical protein
MYNARSEACSCVNSAAVEPSKEQGIGERTLAVSRARMYYHTLFLIHHNHLFIFIDHIQRYIFREQSRRFWISPPEFKLIPAFHHTGYLHGFPIEPRFHSPGFNLRAGKQVETFCHIPVKSEGLGNLGLHNTRI